MALIRPFMGLRYNTDKISEIAAVVAPPYDVIPGKLQDSLYRLHPNNVVRLILGKEEPGDTESESRYTRASTFLNSWLKERILVRDTVPSLYLYSQTYTFNNKTSTRTGFISLFRLEQFDKGKIRPHENTLSKPKEDRLKLTKACKAQFSQVFALYADKERSIEPLFHETVKSDPLLSFTDESSVSHSLWQITDNKLIATLTRRMENREVLIADGHHRYETALNYMNYRKTPRHTGDEPYNYMMMYFTNCHSNGLSIFPTHRIVSKIADFSPVEFLKKAKKLFSIEKIDIPDSEPGRSKALLESIETDETGRKIIGACLGSNNYVTLSLKNPDIMSSIIGSGKSEALMSLDVSILHSALLMHTMGLTEESQREQKNITYTVHAHEAIRSVDKGEANAAFFLNPTRIDEIQNVARAGEKMPQKSTFFYPKLKSGLVFNLLD